MFDYYKINTGVLPRLRECTKSTHNKTLGRNYFSKNWFVLLTSQSQIEYLSNCSIQNLNETRLTNNDLRNKNEDNLVPRMFYKCSLGNKTKFVRSVNNEI